jgi:hypothetical protein
MPLLVQVVPVKYTVAVEVAVFFRLLPIQMPGVMALFVSSGALAAHSLQTILEM